MRAINRRRALALVSGIGMFAVKWPALALAQAEKLDDVWPEVQAGAFDVAVQRLQLHVTEWPLDREARTSLAIMQFAAEIFDQAVENLGRIVKLGRASASGAGGKLDIEYLEAWYRLAQLRAGDTPDTPQPGSPHSLLRLLQQGQGAKAFAADLTIAYFDFLDRLERDISKTTVTTENGATITTTTNVRRPDRDAVERAYHCIGNFMLGEQARSLGKAADGKKLFGEAVATRANDAIEYFIAKAEFARLT
jgi:hypothetical protein